MAPASGSGPMTRVEMWAVLVVVAGAAAVLSLSALRDLASLCGFPPNLAWLLPIVIDVRAAAGCLVWLRADAGRTGIRFARSPTWLLLAPAWRATPSSSTWARIRCGRRGGLW